MERECFEGNKVNKDIVFSLWHFRDIQLLSAILKVL